MKKILKDSLALFLITLVAGILLGLVYKITKEPIKEQEEKTKLAAYRSVFSTLDSTVELGSDKLDAACEAVKKEGYTGVTVNEIVAAYDKDKKYLGLIITITDANGYGGNIKMSVGIDSEGTITGLEFLDINETAGLGMKAKDASFRKQFVGMKAEYVKYTKSDEKAPDEFDAISSATITSKAVCEGVNGALITFRTVGGSKDE